MIQYLPFIAALSASSICPQLAIHYRSAAPAAALRFLPGTHDLIVSFPAPKNCLLVVGPGGWSQVVEQFKQLGEEEIVGAERLGRSIRVWTEYRPEDMFAEHALRLRVLHWRAQDRKWLSSAARTVLKRAWLDVEQVESAVDSRFAVVTGRDRLYKLDLERGTAEVLETWKSSGADSVRSLGDGWVRWNNGIQVGSSLESLLVRSSSPPLGPISNGRYYTEPLFWVSGRLGFALTFRGQLCRIPSGKQSIIAGWPDGIIDSIEGGMKNGQPVVLFTRPISGSGLGPYPPGAYAVVDVRHGAVVSIGDIPPDLGVRPGGVSDDGTLIAGVVVGSRWNEIEAFRVEKQGPKP